MQYRPYNYYNEQTYQNDEYNHYMYPVYPNYAYSQLNGPPPSPPQQTPYEQFAKPQQPINWETPMQQSANFMQPNGNGNFNQQPNPYPANGIKNYFQDKDGQVDFDKMLSTVGQLANTYHQVSPIVKQFGSIIKNFR